MQEYGHHQEIKARSQTAPETSKVVAIEARIPLAAKVSATKATAKESSTTLATKASATPIAEEVAANTTSVEAAITAEAATSTIEVAHGVTTVETIAPIAYASKDSAMFQTLDILLHFFILFPNVTSISSLASDEFESASLRTDTRRYAR
jgi:hypothetical protein